MTEKIKGMIHDFFNSNIFFGLYRIIFPIILGILFFIIPWLKLSISEYKPFDWIILLFITAMLSGTYHSVTILDEVPSKGAPWLRLWTRFGTFKKNKFVPYFDRSSFRYIYFLNAIVACVTTSVVLGYMLIINDIFSEKISFVIGMINFILLFVPYAYHFNDFEEAVYRSELATNQVINIPE